MALQPGWAAALDPRRAANERFVSASVPRRLSGRRSALVKRGPAALLQLDTECGRGYAFGPTEIEPLEMRAPVAAQTRGLLDILHAFGGDLDPQAMTERGDRLDDRLGLGVVANLLEETLVDLDAVERERTQIMERRIPSAEVVEHDLHAQRLERFEQADVVARAHPAGSTR